VANLIGKTRAKSYLQKKAHPEMRLFHYVMLCGRERGKALPNYA